MSNVSSGHPCIVAFEGHYAKLVESLPTNAMWDMLVSKGLLSDTTLRQSMFAEKTDWGKTRLLLEWMRPGLIVGVNHSFLQLLEVMEEFGRTKNDQAVMKLAENIHKDLPPEAVHITEYNQAEHRKAKKEKKTFTAQFSKLVFKIEWLLDKNCGDKLELCKSYCTKLCISDESDQIIFGDDKLPKLQASKSFRDLFLQLRHHWGWDEWSILEQLIDISESPEAEVELNKYKQFLASKHAIEIIPEQFSNVDLPPNYVKFQAILDQPYTKITVQEYSEIKEFICGFLKVKKYIFHPYINFLFRSLHLEWYIPALAAVYMIEMANLNKEKLIKNSIVFMKIGEEVVFDFYHSQTKKDSVFHGNDDDSDDDTQFDKMPGSGRNKTLSSGYGYKFINTVPDRLVCKICQLPCREAQKCAKCGHIYCKVDLDHMKSITSIDYKCPMCCAKPFITFPDTAVDREIKCFRISCPNEDGCGWIGEFHDLSTHIKDGKCCDITCQYCNDLVKPTAFSIHINDECPCHCQYCGTTAAVEMINKYHKKNCLRNSYLFKWFFVFVFQQIQPKRFYVFDSPIANSVARFLVILYFSLFCIAVLSYNTGMPHKNLLHAIDEQQEQILPVIFRITDLMEKIKENVPWESNSFFATNGGIEMCLSVYANGKGDGEGTHVSVYLHFMPSNNDIQQFKDWGTITIALLNQNSDTGHYTENTKLASDIEIMEYPQFISHQTLFRLNEYLVDNTLYFRIAYEDANGIASLFITGYHKLLLWFKTLLYLYYAVCGKSCIHGLIVGIVVVVLEVVTNNIALVYSAYIFYLIILWIFQLGTTLDGLVWLFFCHSGTMSICTADFVRFNPWERRSTLLMSVMAGLIFGTAFSAMCYCSHP